MVSELDVRLRYWKLRVRIPLEVADSKTFVDESTLLLTASYGSYPSKDIMAVRLAASHVARFFASASQSS